jgi:glucose-1-phosphate thymidylyltransferase
VIGRGARVADSYIGPYTAIGDDCTVENSEVEHSILLAGASIRDLPGRVEASLIGRSVSISRTEALPRVFRFVVGDGSDITIL